MSGEVLSNERSTGVRMKPRVLFISHDASRTGAPLFLLTLLKWLRDNDEVDFSVLLSRGGELERDFTELGRCYNFELPTSWLQRLGLGRISRKLHRLRLLRRLRKDEYDLVYSNTATNGQILEYLSGMKCPVVTHVHELEYVIKLFGERNLQQVLKYSDSFIASTEVVKRQFAANSGVPAERIELIRCFVVHTPTMGHRSRDLISRELQLPENAFVVGFSGPVEWRKGSDLLVRLADFFVHKRADLPIYFVWVGNLNDQLEMAKIRFDSVKLGVQERLVFTGAVQSPADYFYRFDLFCLASREEPFGIVGIESANLGKPVICFEGCGGFPEFVEADAGIVVPYLDVEALAASIEMLYRNPNVAEKLGERGRKKVQDQYTLEVLGPSYAEKIKKLATTR